MTSQLDKSSPGSPNDYVVRNGKRKRAVVACTCCRRRKTKCDAVRPTCGNCARSKLHCEYPSLPRRKRSGSLSGPSHDPGDKLRSRIDKLERMLELVLESQGINYTEPQTRDECLSDDSSFSDSANESGSDDGQSVIGGTDVAPMDIFQIQERRMPSVLQWGDYEPSSTYSHGITHMLMSPKSMRWLCEGIGNISLGKNAETLLSRLWKRKTEVSLDSRNYEGANGSLDPIFIEKSMVLHAESTSEIYYVLLDSRDIQVVNKLCCPSGDYSKINMKSPYAIMYPALLMIMTFYGSYDHSNAPLKDYSVEYINTQTEIAYNLCVKHISLLAATPSTFLLLRLLMISIFTAQRRAMVPQLRPLVSIAICMALHLGLHRGEGSRYLSVEEQKRRSHTWALVQDTDIRLSASLSLMPLLANIDSVPVLNKHDFKPGGDMHALSYSMDLNRIYLEVYERLFSSKARKSSIKSLLRRIARLDKKLNDWKDNLPESWVEMMNYVNAKEKQESILDKEMLGPGPRNSQINEEDPLVTNFGSGVSREKCCMWVHANSIVCYYNIMILIHSIPAFSPSSLTAFDNDPGGVPPRLMSSLSAISESAQGILKFSFNAKEVTSDQSLAMTATNAFSALFLKQIRDPMHVTNGDDLIQIYRYMARFRHITKSNTHVDSSGIMNIWLVFANALTQLNNEYPSSRHAHKSDELKSKSKVTITPPNTESRHTTLTQERIVSPSQRAPQPAKLQHVLGKTPSLVGSSNSVRHSQPLAHLYHPEMVKTPSSITSATALFGTNSVKPISQSQTVPLTPSSMYMVPLPSTPQPQSPQQRYESNQVNPQGHSQQPIPGILSPSHILDNNVTVEPTVNQTFTETSWPNRSHGLENNLWDTFSGMAGSELDLQNDISHLYDAEPTDDFQGEQALNNCIIC